MVLIGKRQSLSLFKLEIQAWSYWWPSRHHRRKADLRMRPNPGDAPEEPPSNNIKTSVIRASRQILFDLLFLETI